jgi:subtilase family serine protease
MKSQPVQGLALSFLFFFLCPILTSAQSSNVLSRIAQPIDDNQRVTLRGNVHPLAQARYDQGAVPDSFPAERMLLLLKRSPESEAALQQFLQDAHTLGSPSYHKWLTAEQFGTLYGPADSDVAVVKTWLQSQGFSVARVTKGKTAIEFSGNAGQLRKAFNTEIHSYGINGVEHHANNRDPQIPAALAAVVAGITPMNDFRPKSYAKILGQAVYDRSLHKFVPQWTFPSQADLLTLGPGDFALQYDLNPLYAEGITGTGVTIGIIGASNVDPTVVAAYRSFFGLPAGRLNVVLDGQDPGQNYALVESYVDLEISGAVAPEATINLYTSADTSLQSGLILAAQRAVDDDIATVLSTSYGTCEQDLGSAGNQFWAGLWEQAAAQGQTPFVATGDGGPAGCDDFQTAQVAQDGIAINGFASTPWNVAVGGTDFYYSSYNGTTAAQQSELQTYWDTVGTLFPTTSLLKPVPEQPWDDPFGLNLSTGGVYNPQASTIAAGSGGPSNCSTGVEATNGTYSSCSGGYAKPSWQSGSGVPADGVRDLPDVSLFAAASENDSAYALCTLPGECIVSDGNLTITVGGGTSASTPAMAAIMALINQRYGAQGQANYKFYALAAQHRSAFHDVTLGSNMVPCQQGSPNCTLSSANDNTKGFYTLGYYAGPGYDLATGLGSVDASLLIQYWDSLTFKPTATTLSLSSTTFTHGAPIDVSVGVSGSGGTPSGDVALVSTASPASNTSLGEVTLQSGAATTTIDSLPGGQYQLTARYAGDTLFASSTSIPVSLNVSPENSTVSLSGQSYSYYCYPYLNFYPYPGIPSTPLSNAGSYPYGGCIGIDAQPRGVNAPQGSLDGIPTGTVTFTDTISSGGSTSATLNVDRTGSAEWVPASGFAVGTHTVTATYSGDASFNAFSSSTPLTFTIAKVTPGMGLGVGPPFNYGNEVGVGTPVTLSANVGITGAAVPPGGTVTFNLGSSVLGTATLGPWPYNPSVGTASLIVSTLPVGTDAITASYGGDANYNLATSTGPVDVVVMQPASLTASASPTTINPLQNFTVTGSVSGAAGQPAPTGSLEFSATGPYWSWSAGATLVNGSASFTFTSPVWNVGPVTVNVQYSGDSNYAPVSTVVPLSVTNPFTLTATPVLISAPGATTGNTSTITVTPETGFTGQAYFACKIESYPPGAQHLPTCSVPTVSLTGPNPVITTMTIYSTAPTTATISPPRLDPPSWLGLRVGIVLAAFLVIGIVGRLQSRRLASLLITGALFAALAGCGGVGNAGGGGGGTPIPGTTPGNYIFMLEAGYTPLNAGQSNPSQILMVNVTIQ